MITLNRDVRLVLLQFNFSNSDAVPATVKRLNPETKKESTERKSRSSGVMVIEPTLKCSIVAFLDELEEAGYEMVDAFYNERVDAKDTRGRRTYHMVRFTFARHEFVDLSDEFRGMRSAIRAELRDLCGNAMWRVRAFSNPFYIDGMESPDQRTLCINLEVRQPLFRPDGRPIMVWQKDESGNRVGDAPLPLKADYYLWLVDNVVSLMGT
ncbi:MAG: hypothetical protein Q8L47_02125 [bacterium]|nr:hypothetical protein [bacterium]